MKITHETKMKIYHKGNFFLDAFLQAVERNHMEVAAQSLLLLLACTVGPVSNEVFEKMEEAIKDYPGTRAQDIFKSLSIARKIHFELES